MQGRFRFTRPGGGSPAERGAPAWSSEDGPAPTPPVPGEPPCPAVFRLVLEVTSSNHNNGLRNKVAAYAEAKIPVYVIVDRRHGRVHALTEPVGGTYDRHEVYAPGQEAPLPASTGAEVVLAVAGLIEAGRARS